MMSFQAPLFPKNLDQQRKTISSLETSPSKKRKWDDLDPNDQYSHDPNKIKSCINPTLDLHLETPLPSEWQRCLDIQSGEIHFYNTRTKRRTVRDPRPSELQRPSHMSLDLELNLPCGDYHNKNRAPPHTRSVNNSADQSSAKQKTLSLFTTSSSISTAIEGEETEMVAAVCKRCHMLVVLCKSSPACPNCKFMHPPDTSPLPKFMIKPKMDLVSHVSI